MSRLTRRAFVRAAAGTAAVLPALRTITALAADHDIPIGIQSFSLRNYSTDEAIRLAKQLGFAHIEFFKGQFDPAASPEVIAEMRKKMAAAGLQMLGHGVNKFTKDHAANEAFFQFAQAAGLRNLTADPDPDSFDSLDELVDKYDVRIAIHNHGPRHRYNKAVDVLQACEGHDQRIGACADLGHFIRSGEDPVQVIRLLGSRLYGIHLKDFAEEQDQTEGVILGEGHLDLVGMFQALRSVNFPVDGCLSLEYEENPQDPIADIQACLKAAQDAQAKA